MNSSFEQHTRDSPSEETFPEAWRTYLRENVFLYGLFTPAEQSKLCRLTMRFIDSKFWEGCAGLCITDEIRVTIAGQACLLVLGFDDYCFEECKTILVYPGGFLNLAEDHAVRDLTRARRLCRYRTETYIQRALAYLGQKQYDRALADCNEALRLDPDNADVYRARADVYEAKGETELAQRDQDEAAKNDAHARPRSPAARG